MRVSEKHTVGIENTAHSFIPKFGQEMFVPDLVVSIWFVEINLLLKNVFGTGGDMFAVEVEREGGRVVVVDALGEAN